MSTKSIVVDSSVLFALFFPEECSEWSEEMIRKYDELHVPEIVFLETSNAAWKRIIIFKQPSDIVLKNLRLLHKFISDVCIIHRDRDYLQRAIELAIKLGTTIYDSLFLAIAEKYKTKVLTIDRKLVKILKRMKEEHRVISPVKLNEGKTER